MKNVILALVASVALAGTAVAGEYAGIDYQSKQRSGVDEQHDVLGVSVGATLGTKLYAEGRMEE